MWSYEKDITCKSCGKKYELYSMKIPMRDNDREMCSCGSVLYSWKESKMYNVRPIEKKNSVK